MTSQTKRFARLLDHCTKQHFEDAQRTACMSTSERIGRTQAHVRWALAAAEAGEMHNVIKYLHRAQKTLGDRVGPTDLYIAGIPQSGAPVTVPGSNAATLWKNGAR